MDFIPSMIGDEGLEQKRDVVISMMFQSARGLGSVLGRGGREAARRQRGLGPEWRLWG